ncbi:MAG: hypothetical protein NTX25_02135, partial [Proteobacteria bacterium]|nr:hypothetical protein [Pseudomonadota bacterium]
LILVISCHKSRSDDIDLGKADSSNAIVQEDSSRNFISVVATVEDLPSCNSINPGQLVYVTTDKKFVTCDGTSWQGIEINKMAPTTATTQAPAPVMPGLTISSIQEINPGGMNFCANNLGCFFDGGQLTSFSDGSKQITGSGKRVDFNTQPNFIDRAGFNLWVGPKVQVYSTRLIDRGIRTVNGNLTNIHIYLVYNRKPETLTLYSDNMMNGFNAAEDTAIFTLELGAPQEQ